MCSVMYVSIVSNTRRCRAPRESSAVQRTIHSLSLNNISRYYNDFRAHRCCRVINTSVCRRACMYGHIYSKSMDQPGKVANPARGQLNRENGFFSVPVRA